MRKCEALLRIIWFNIKKQLNSIESELTNNNIPIMKFGTKSIDKYEKEIIPLAVYLGVSGL